MNIVTSVRVYPQGGTVETVSQKKNIPPLVALKAPQNLV